MKGVLLAALRFYQRAISPVFGPRCRFYPSCSAYAVEAVERHGAARGTWLAVGRLIKCGPWHPGGVDLVPDRLFGRGGTGDPGRSSMSETPAPLVRTPSGRSTHRPSRAIPPAARRTPQQEAGVA